MNSISIKQLRVSMALTQGQFAQLIGVTQRAVAYWESGTRVPNSTSVKLIERAHEATKRV